MGLLQHIIYNKINTRYTSLIMCLAIPAQITKFIQKDNATINMAGIEQDINISLLEDLKIGDYVIVHAGFAISKLLPEEAEETLRLFEEFYTDQ